MSIHASRILPPGWQDLITSGAKTTIGLDLATSENDTSNPSALSIMQEVGRDYIARVMVRWKTKDPDVTSIVAEAACRLPHNLRPTFIVDSSNERFFAKTLTRSLSRLASCHLYFANEKVQYLGEDIERKTLVGNLLRNALHDGRLILPEDRWIFDDLRLVKDHKGGFLFETDKDGNHADAAQSLMLCMEGFLKSSSGRVEARACGTGSLGRLFGVPSSRGDRPQTMYA